MLNKLIQAYGSIILSVILIILTWFGFGAWLRNQPSSFLYIAGTMLNIIVPIILILIVNKTIKNLGEKK